MSTMTTFSRSSDAPAADVAAAAWERTPPLRPHEFRRLRELLYETCGIRLRDGKEELVRSRLGRRVVDAGAPSFAAYLDRIENDASRRQFAELGALVDALTTNQTAFFREPAHFEFFIAKVLPRMAQATQPVRVWSAGCSTGEEPFTIAALMREHLPADRFGGARILATDVSSRVLARARAATYGARAITAIPATLRRRMLDVSASGDRFVVREELRAVVRFARLNLIRDWPLRGPFDAIFCRNVMIYFDAGVRQRLVERFWRVLAPGGHLFVGHSESLGTMTHGFRYVQPAVYVR